MPIHQNLPGLVAFTWKRLDKTQRHWGGGRSVIPCMSQINFPLALQQEHLQPPVNLFLCEGEEREYNCNHVSGAEPQFTKAVIILNDH